MCIRLKKFVYLRYGETTVLTCPCIQCDIGDKRQSCTGCLRLTVTYVAHTKTAFQKGFHVKQTTVARRYSILKHERLVKLNRKTPYGFNSVCFLNVFYCPNNST